ncbi:MAG: 50S ribosomal protein L11 methyltransferase [Ignavibacteriales bacterium]|nr:50S ribosomal protein L11 methyltransferase [Ignavibacteriales bacterium]
MRRRRWLQIVFTLPEWYQELLVGQLALLSFAGFTQEETRLTCTIAKNRWNATLERRLETLLSRFRAEFPDADTRFSVSTFYEQNWNARWEQSTGIVEATDRIIIKPSWKKLRKKDKGKIVLHIDPKMSFGTGHHETTRLCLSLLQRYLREGMKVLDVGSGTGVLAIAAVKLGAETATGFDQDPWAVRNAQENAKRNKVEGRVSIRNGTFSTSREKADLILSNIDLPTNLQLLPDMLKRLRRAGILILSGLLAGDLQKLLDSLEHRNALPIEFVVENEWAAVALTNVDAT